jgi:ABC-2 type transport system permease protein
LITRFLAFAKAAFADALAGSQWNGSMKAHEHRYHERRSVGTMTGALAKYAKVFNVGAQNTFVYRWNFVLRSVFGIVPLIGTIFLWKAMYGGTGGTTLSGYTYSQLILYFAMTVFVQNLVTPGEDEWQIATEIRDGKMSFLLLKPLNYLAYRFTLYASNRLLYMAVLLPGIALIFFFLREHITLPSHALTWIFFALGTAMAALIQFFIAYAIAMLAFWILEISTVVFMVFSIEYFLSGQIFPLDMLPAWLSAIVKWSPFPYEMYFPVQIFMERVGGAKLAQGLAIQAFWVVVMWLLAVGLWRRGIRRYQAVGI